ncbi:TfoX/Sxy family protein [Hyphomonas pacifica]|uniref:TfoX/Sxy family protein n=1 Tax=Hyphomonas pacifica TaxID=1280941 RepID=UPI000DC016EE|nr:TfoX/Sxy family protein [Hyphomonas pacifica]RAN38397.1 hypothetical protein HY11_00875 [Hyphomonas pacifica]
MPKPPDPFHEFVAEVFGPMGAVRVRRMFGGAGVFLEGVMFALLDDETIYLKTDPDLRAALEDEGGASFIWTRPGDGKQIDMGYVRIPDAALDDPDLASEWGRRALAAALATKKN